MTIGLRRRLVDFCLCALLGSGVVAHAAIKPARPLAHPTAAPVPRDPKPAADPRTAVHEAKVSFADFGVGALNLQGVQSTVRLNLGTRRDEVVVGAVLHLRMIYSPSLLPELSHLRVSLNGQTLAALALPKADAGREIERDIQLDPRYFSDYNEIRFELIGHYTLECEDPQHSSLWATISPQSTLTLSLSPIDLRDDLSLLPVPFFDPHDNRPLTLPIVLGKNPTRDIVRSAGIAASWFGLLADYRGARFPVSFDVPPSRHAMVFATNESRPTGLSLPTVNVPTVRIEDHPDNPLIKLLVFQGRDADQLRRAVEGLALGSAVLTGDSASIAEVSHPAHVPYDAPRWLRTDRPIRIGELVDSADQLQAYGIAPPPITVNLRLPPDLFTWSRAGVPIDLHYRYTSPNERDNSILTVTVNNQLLRSYHLAAESENGSGGKFVVPLLQTDRSRQSRDLLIPAFQLASDNQLQFKFAMEYHRQGLCKEVFTDNDRESIDPDSTIDISSFPHYTALPNLALFANSGFPFTRYADLAQTAIVLPDSVDAVGLEQLFVVLGRMGRQTGAVALAYQLLDAQQALTARDVDLLILSGAGSNALVSRWGHDLSLVFDAADRNFHPGRRVPRSPNLPTLPKAVGETPDVQVRAGGSLGAIMSFESPLTSGRTVVALLGTDGAAGSAVTDVLGNDGKVSLIHGDLAIVRGEEVESYQGSTVYYLGSLAWWQWLWFHFSQHALLLILASLTTAILAALLIYGWLQRLAARRLEPRPPA